MTDESKDNEASSPERNELAETPFGGYTPTPPAEEHVPQDEQEQAPLEEPCDIVEELAASQEVEVADEAAEPEETVTPAAEEKVADEAAVPAEQVKAAAPEAEKEEETGGPVDYSDTFRRLTEGDVVEGTVVHIDKEGVLVDVGTKSEGVIRLSELAREPFQDPEEIVQVGQKVPVYVLNTETDEGTIQLSKKRADFELAWSRVEEAYREGKVISAMVSDRVKGGLVVDLGIRGFVPCSHVGSGKTKSLERYVGQSLPLKVIEVDRERRKVVLSHRLAVEEEREKHRKSTLSSLAEGQIRQGVVRRLTEYGAFVDLGGIDGLLHISEMSWTRINHPSDVLRVGQHIQVVVLKLNLDQGRVSLGLRQILPDPWREVAGRYSEGDVVKGRVTRLVPFGAFVQIDGAIEGIIPVAELAPRRVNKPEDVVEVGQELEVKIVDLRPEERRMTLSLRQLHQERERREYTGYVQQASPRTTVGELVGEALNKAKRRRAEADEEERGEVPPTKAPKSRGKPGAHKRAREEEEIIEEDLSQLEAEEVPEEPEAAVEPEPEAVEPEAEPEPMVTLGELLGDKIAAVEEPEAAEQPAEPEAAAPEEKPKTRRRKKTEKPEETDKEPEKPTEEGS